MLKTVRKAFQIEDIRKRLFYTFLIMIVVRFGSQLPTPGVDPTYIHKDVSLRTEHHTIHYIFHHYAAFDNCNSEA